ncbi:phosphatase inhibitor-domain-containing protein [Infundibulicybe gibba]|nr:phosphatase inhibitor-domain-containing protein [Infundibulicybe gibba]
MAYLATQQRPSTSAPGDGSRTITITGTPPIPDDGSNPGDTSDGVLRLRGATQKNKQRVAWGEDVVDNEGCGKKKSKICCIYHKPKRFDESSDEDSSDSDTDSSCGQSPHAHPHSHRHAPQHEGGGAQMRTREGSTVVHQLEDQPEPNAYETVPSKKGKRRYNVNTTTSSTFDASMVWI